MKNLKSRLKQNIKALKHYLLEALMYIYEPINM